MSVPTVSPTPGNRGSENAKERFLSWSESLLPVIFAGLEASWLSALLYGLAIIHFFGLRQPVLPFWSPLLLMISSCWFASSSRAGQGLANRLLAPIALFCIGLLVIWSNIYASTRALLDPFWLIDIPNQLLFLSPTGYAIAGTILLICGFYYRGIVLARRTPEPSQVRNSLVIGGCIFLAVFLFQSYTESGRAQLLLLLLFFFALAAFSRALSHMSFIRHNHLVNLEGSRTAQDYLILTIVATMTLTLLCIGTIIGIAASPAFLVEVQSVVGPVYLIFTYALAWIGVIIVAPFIWLLDLLQFRTPELTIPENQRPVFPENQPIKQTQPPPYLEMLAGLAVTLVVLLIIVLLAVLLLRIVARKRVKQERSIIEIREDLWSWQLFWQQLRWVLNAIRQKLFGKRQLETPASGMVQEAIEEQTPEAYSIRELYRVFLRWASANGFTRTTGETPAEFKQRLVAQKYGDEEGALAEITTVYSAVRYGEMVPQSSDVSRMQEHIQTLQQKV